MREVHTCGRLRKCGGAVCNLMASRYLLRIMAPGMALTDTVTAFTAVTALPTFALPVREVMIMMAISNHNHQ